MKLSNPLGKGKTVWISQTYHGKYNRAIDIGNVKEGDPLFSLGDGTISTVGSYYCILNLKESNLRVWYTHCKKLPKKGQVFKNGIKVCEVGKSSAIHVHLGLTWKDGHEPRPNIIDYFDRDIKFATKYASIIKSWFLSSEKINWNLHKDLDYKTNKPIPIVKPPVVDLHKECKETINDLVTKNIGLKLGVGALGRDLEVERGKVLAREDIILGLDKTVATREKKIEELNSEIEKLKSILCDLGIFSTRKLLSELLSRVFKSKLFSEILRKFSRK